MDYATSSPAGEPDWSEPLRLVGGVLLILAATVGAYYPALGAGFVWDDADHFAANPLMTMGGGLWKIWSGHQFYYPLTSSSFWIMRRLWDLNPQPYHLTNILLHGLNSILLWRITRRLGMAWPFWCGVVFALHPVHVQSVAWVTELKNVQSGLFYLLSVWFYVRFMDTGRRANYAWSLGLFVLALLSKTSTVTLPFIVTAAHLWTIGRPDRRVVTHLAPYFCVSLVSGLVTILLHRGQVSSLHDWDETLLQRCLLAARGIWFYLAKLAWPSLLVFVYPRWEFGSGWAVWLLAPVGVALVAVGGLLIRNPSARMAVLLGLGCFAASLLPVLNFFKMFYTRYSYTADHWQYLADLCAIPLAVALVAALTRLGAARMGEGSAGGLGRLALINLSLLFGVLTHLQCADYADLETLWRRTIVKNPRAVLAHVNLGMKLASEGRGDTAAYHFKQAVAIRSDIPEPYIGMAAIESETGQMERAEALLRKALELQPESAEALSNLAGVCLATNREDEALALLRRALKLRPENVSARVVMGRALERTGRMDEAVRYLDEAIRMDPTHPSADQYLGEIYSRLGRLAEAERHLRRALEIDPHNLSALISLGGVYGNAKRGADAVRVLTEAVRLSPQNAWARYNLGVALIQSGREAEGNAELAEAERLQPGLLAEIEARSANP